LLELPRMLRAMPIDPDDVANKPLNQD
jgi:hypothetical protein